MPSFTDSNSTSSLPYFGLAISSGLLLYASFFPLNLGFLAWIALVPMLFLLHAPLRPRQRYVAIFVGGLACYLPAIQWMRVAHPAMYATWILLALMCSLYVALSFWLIRVLERRHVPTFVVLPFVWVGFEYWRANFPTGFSWLASLGLQSRIGFNWYFLGYTQHDFLPIIQISDITGVYGVSFLVAMVNGAIYLWVRKLVSPASYRNPWLATAVASLVFAGVYMKGISDLGHASFDVGPRVTLLQSNLPQSVKMEAGSEVITHLRELLTQAIPAKGKSVPDLLVWPETTCMETWFDVADGVKRLESPIPWQQGMVGGELFAQQMAEIWQCNQLLGLNAVEWEPDGTVWKYNTAKLIYKNGKPAPDNPNKLLYGGPRYDKMHLVPFGEYVPLGRTFPWMRSFTPYSHEYSCKPGEHWTRFPLPVGNKTYQFGCIICYEDSDPSLARRYVHNLQDGPDVDFLVNISNDGWFNGTEEHEEHLAICRFARLNVGVRLSGL